MVWTPPKEFVPRENPSAALRIVPQIQGNLVENVCENTWTSATLLNSWVNYASTFLPLRYRKQAGIVSVEGLVRSGTTGLPITNLPAGYRPAAQLLYTTMSNGTIGGFSISTGGDVTLTSGSNAWISINASFQGV